MARAEKPSSPTDELIARRAWSGTGGGVLTPDLATFCESGLSILVATDGGDGWPAAGLAVACRVAPPGTLRIVLRRSANETILAPLADGAGIAATFSLPSTHRSIQFKAPGARIEAADADDIAAAERQADGFRQDLTDVGYSAFWATVLTGFDREDLAVAAFEPVDAFVQTPGPGAGSLLTR